MKIGLICPYGINKGGGVLEVVKSMQAELLKRGHDAYIITPRPRNHAEPPDDHVIFIGTSTDFKSPVSTTVQISSSDRDDIDEMLAREKFDILHFHEPWIPMLGAQMLPRSNCVNVATFHASLPDNMVGRTMGKVWAPFTKPLLKYIDAFAATGEVAADYVCSLTDVPVAIIPLSIDQELYHPPKKFDDNRKQKTILYVGRLEGRKGVKYLVHAFKLLQEKHPDVSLRICGAGPDREKLEMLVDDLELKNVTFTGYISTEDKVRYLQEADLYCSPAVFGEGFGIVLLEAMATRTVTVAGDNPGYAGVMRGLGELSLVDPKHDVELARRLELLLYQPKLRALWREWATGELPQYTSDATISQYIELYEWALAQPKRKHA